ncbi:MAG: CRTAC1 family protein [Deinococcus sp.]|nr:CRTAC1 family protein [Deinococcus sp.]
MRRAVAVLGILALALAVGALAQSSGTFVSVAEQAGVDFRPFLPTLQGPVGFAGAGVAVGDYDRDGLLDLYFPNTYGANRLYRNLGNFQFTEVAAAVGAALPDDTSHGAVFFDYDNDGDLDLYVTNTGPNRLLRNDGGVFTEVGASAGVDDAGNGTSATVGDYNNDSWLDLYVGNFSRADEGPDDDTVRNLLYRNNGDGTFTNVAPIAGVDSIGHTWAAHFFDYDNDGDQDLYVANDRVYGGVHDNFYRNDGVNPDTSEIQFTDIVVELGLDVLRFSMGAAVGDYDNDGWLDLFVTDIGRNWLYHNEGDGTFREVSEELGVKAGKNSGEDLVSWGAQWFDYDNDGLLDLFVPNGHTVIGPLRAFVQVNLLFHQNQAGTFDEVGADMRVRKVTSSRGAEACDLDGDGRLDLLVSTRDAPVLLYRNEVPAENFLMLTFQGTVSNRDAVGTRVYLTTNGVTQQRLVTSGGSTFSASDYSVHFGLGDARLVDQIRIVFPSGRERVLSYVAANQRIHVIEPGGR